MASSRRDQLIDTAARMFYRHGCHATGIDKVLAEAGVAKMTLYKHFRSKEELILAAIRRLDEQGRNELVRAVERRAATPAERLLAVFDVVGKWVAGEGFCGCPFVNVAAEYSCHDDPIHRAAAEHKRLQVKYLRDLAQAAGAADPDHLARQLSLLLQGAIVMPQVTGDIGYARDARDAAAELLRRSLS